MLEKDEKQFYCDPPDKGCAARSEMYAWLADLLSFPANIATQRNHKSLVIKGIDLCRDLPFEFDITLNDLQFTDVSEAQETYSRLFDVGEKKPVISLLERRYTTISEQQLWEDLLRFYSHFHLDFSKGFSIEQIDHLSTELSFMHYLSFLEAGGGPDKESIERGQRDFLSEHLLAFSVGILNKLKEHDDSSIYCGYSSILATFVEVDFQFLRLQQPISD